MTYARKNLVSLNDTPEYHLKLLHAFGHLFLSSGGRRSSATAVEDAICGQALDMQIKNADPVADLRRNPRRE